MTKIKYNRDPDQEPTELGSIPWHPIINIMVIMGLVGVAISLLVMLFDVGLGFALLTLALAWLVGCIVARLLQMEFDK